MPYSFSVKKLAAITMSLFLVSGVVPSVAQTGNDVAVNASSIRSPLPPKAARYPVKDDALSIQNAYRDPRNNAGRMVLVEGSVKSVASDAANRTSVELALSSEPQTSIWAMFAITVNRRMSLHAGDRVRIAGWLMDSAAWSKRVGVELPRQKPMTMLAICLVKPESLEAVYDKKFTSFCDAWERAYVPPHMDMSNGEVRIVRPLTRIDGKN